MSHLFYFFVLFCTNLILAHFIAQGNLYLGGWIAFLAVFTAADGIKRWTALSHPIKVSKTYIEQIEKK